MPSAHSRPSPGPLPMLLPLVFAACAGVAPRPEAARASDLPVVAPTEEQRARTAEHEALAVEAVVRRRWDEAEAAAERALAIDPRAARARAVVGMVALQRASREDPVGWHGLRAGETQLELARQLAPDDAFVGWLRAVYFAECGHVSAAAAAAEDALQRAGAASPSERAALLGIAGTYRYELGEERAALPHLQAYVGLRPDDATAWFRLGACLLRVAEVPQGIPPASLVSAQRQAEGAARAFARCFELAPGDEDAALAVVAALLRAAELAEERGDDAARDEQRSAAAERLGRLAELFPGSAEVRFRVGVVAALTARPEAARAAYLAALERDPEHAGALLNLASLLVESGDVAGARALLERLMAADARSRQLSRDERRRVERWLAEPADGGRGQMPRML